MEEELKILLIPKDPNDDKDVIVEIRAAAGEMKLQYLLGLNENVFKIRRGKRI